MVARTAMIDDYLLLDASVLVELVAEGNHAASAAQLLKKVATSPGLGLMTAPHGLVESPHARGRMLRSGALSSADADRAIEWLNVLDVTFDPSSSRLLRVWQLREVMSAYDASYAATAEALDLQLITVDRRLLRACQTERIPAVHLDEFVAA